MMRDVSHDLGQCWVRMLSQINCASLLRSATPRTSGPGCRARSRRSALLLGASLRRKFGHLGSRVQAALLRGPPGLPPAPPPVALWMRQEAESGACPRAWDAAAEELKELRRSFLQRQEEITRENLLLGPCEGLIDLERC